MKFGKIANQGGNQSLNLVPASNKGQVYPRLLCKWITEGNLPDPGKRGRGLGSGSLCYFSDHLIFIVEKVIDFFLLVLVKSYLRITVFFLVLPKYFFINILHKNTRSNIFRIFFQGDICSFLLNPCFLHRNFSYLLSALIHLLFINRHTENKNTGY